MSFEDLIADRFLRVGRGDEYPKTKTEGVYTVIDMVVSIKDSKDKLRDGLFAIDRARGLENLSELLDSIVGGLERYVRQWSAVIIYSLALSKQYGKRAEVRARDKSIQEQVKAVEPSLVVAVGSMADSAIMEAVLCAMKALSTDKGEEGFAEWMTGVASIASWSVEDIGEPWQSTCERMLIEYEWEQAREGK